jgi:hypothetical protein
MTIGLRPPFPHKNYKNYRWLNSTSFCEKRLHAGLVHACAGMTMTWDITLFYAIELY